ncbi:N-acetylgalactosamine kinase, partial [Trichinella murrelli]
MRYADNWNFLCHSYFTMIESTNDVSQFSELLQAFRDRYNCEAEYVVKSPGRINIIGEHIDYCGYAVLPMAINECIYAAFSVNQHSEELTVCNTDTEYDIFGLYSFIVGFIEFILDGQRPFEAILSCFTISCNNPCWKDYFLTGVQAAKGHVHDYQDEAGEDAEVKLAFRGFKAMISSKLPARAGLASSSALVCSAAACTMVAVGDGDFRTITKVQKLWRNFVHIKKMPALMVAVWITLFVLPHEKEGSAKYIQFKPLRLDDVTLPPKARFVVFHCGLESAKGAANSLFNKRVTECHLATKFIANVFRLDWRRMNTIKDVQDAVADVDENRFKEIALSAFGQDAYTVAEIISFLQCDECELEMLFYRRYPTKEQFYLKKRARHVIEESMRVKEFRSICDQFAN